MADEENKTPRGEIEQPEASAVPERAREVQGETPEETGEKKKEEGSILFDWVRSLLGAVLIVVLLFLFVAQLITVQGPSMQHTLYAGDRVLVLRAGLCDIQAGDVVMVHQFNAPLNETIIKRVIAVGGQTVDIDFYTGTVYVDGVAIEENYIAERTYSAEGTDFPLTLAEGELFLMGDNRNHSTDSRSTLLGPVDERYVVGKAVFVIFPGRSAQYTGELPGSGERDFSRIGLIR